MSDREKFINMLRKKKGQEADMQRGTEEAAAALGEGIDYATSVFNEILNEMGPPPKLPDNVVLFRQRKTPKKPQK